MGLTVFWSQPKSNPIERKNQSNLSTAQVSGPIIGLARPSLITMVGRVLQIQSPKSINNAKTINGALTLKFERLVTPESSMICQKFDIAFNFPILSLQQKDCTGYFKWERSMAFICSHVLFWIRSCLILYYMVIRRLKLGLTYRCLLSLSTYPCFNFQRNQFFTIYEH